MYQFFSTLVLEILFKFLSHLFISISLNTIVSTRRSRFQIIFRGSCKNSKNIYDNRAHVTTFSKFQKLQK